MTTKPSNVGLDRGIYSSPFDAFTNYMNILGDFLNRVNSLYPEEIDNDQLESLLTTIRNQGEEIEMQEKEITRLQAMISKMEEAGRGSKATKPGLGKPTAGKPIAPMLPIGRPKLGKAAVVKPATKKAPVAAEKKEAPAAKKEAATTKKAPAKKAPAKK
jgi:alpha-amylase